MSDLQQRLRPIRTEAVYPSASEQAENGDDFQPNGREPHESASSEARIGNRESVASIDVSRLSMRTSEAYAPPRGNAVTLTRTLSLNRKEWEQLLARPEITLHHGSPKHLPSRNESSVSQASVNAAAARLPTYKHDSKFRSILGLPICHPQSHFIVVWHSIMMSLDLTYTAFIVPIGVGFNISDTAWTWGAVSDFLAGLVFMLDFLLGFHTGYVVSNNFRKRIVMDGKQVAFWYITRGSCIVDFASTVAWLTQVVLIILTLAGFPDRNIASQIQILRILRLARLARMFKSIFMSANDGGVVSLILRENKLSTTAVYFIQLLYSIAVLINFIGCLWYWVADRQGIDGTWITAYDPYISKYGVDGDLTSEMVRSHISKPNLYMTSIYWASATVSTIGYGDVTAQGVVEQAISVLVALIGILFFGVLVGSLTQLLQTASRDARKAQAYREKMNAVEDWLKRRHFPGPFRRRIREHYWAFWLRQEDEADEEQLLQELPHKLQHDALWFMAKKSLKALPAFADLPEELQRLLASHIRPRKFAPGSEISLQGHPATKMYFLDFGKIVPVHHDVEGEPRKEPYMFNCDALLQEMSPVFQKNSRGYRSVTPCGVWEWDVPPFLSVCRRHKGVFEHICQQVLKTLRNQLESDPDSFPHCYETLLQEAEMKLQERFEALSSQTGVPHALSDSSRTLSHLFGETPRKQESMADMLMKDAERLDPTSQYSRSGGSMSKTFRNKAPLDGLKTAGNPEQSAHISVQIKDDGADAPKPLPAQRSVSFRSQPQEGASPQASDLDDETQDWNAMPKLTNKYADDGEESIGEDVSPDFGTVNREFSRSPTASALADINDQLAQLRELISSLRD